MFAAWLRCHVLEYLFRESILSIEATTTGELNFEKLPEVKIPFSLGEFQSSRQCEDDMSQSF